MKTKPVLGADEVMIILQAARQHAQAQGWAVTLSVTDDGGHLLGLLRLDGASPMTAIISPGKARTSAIGRRESGFYEASINGGRTAYLSVPAPVMLEGGVPIEVEGCVIGAVGVSGVKSTQDAEVARAGISALMATLHD